MSDEFEELALRFQEPLEGEDHVDHSEVELTEDGVADALARQLRHVVRFDHGREAWFLWDAGGGYWRKDDAGSARHKARLFVRAVTEANSGLKSEAARKRFREKMRRQAFVSAVDRFMRDDPRCAVGASIDFWDQDALLLGAPGLTVDLRTGEYLAPDPAHRITRRTRIAPDRHAACPLWMAFLDQATGGDETLHRYLQVAAGYALTGLVREHSFFVVHGPGGAGKGTFVGALRAVMGDYAQTANAATFMERPFGEKHLTELVSLRGARLVVIDEIKAGERFDEGRVKSLTGGSNVRANAMRQDEIEFPPTWKLFFVANDLPRTSADTAMQRRLHLVPFVHPPAEPDVELGERLEAEHPAILAWAIRGCREYLTEGLRKPGVMAAAAGAYFSDEDVLGRWIEDECEVGSAEKVGGIYGEAKAIWNAWRRYAMAGAADPGNDQTFSGELRKRGFSKGRKRIGDKTPVVWWGIRLRGLDLP